MCAGDTNFVKSGCGTWNLAWCVDRYHIKPYSLYHTPKTHNKCFLGFRGLRCVFSDYYGLLLVLRLTAHGTVYFVWVRRKFAQPCARPEIRLPHGLGSAVLDAAPHERECRCE